MDHGSDTHKKQDKVIKQDEGSYQLSHIYANLFIMATTNGKWKSFLRRRQQLAKSLRQFN